MLKALIVLSVMVLLAYILFSNWSGKDDPAVSRTPHADASQIHDPKTLDAINAVINENGYNCTKLLIAFAGDADEFGNLFKAVCTGGTSFEGLRYRVSVNPRGNAKVRVGW